MVKNCSRAFIKVERGMERRFCVCDVIFSFSFLKVGDSRHSFAYTVWNFFSIDSSFVLEIISGSMWSEGNSTLL